jgi:hypothetical protein
MTGFIVLGVIAVLAGITLVATGVRGGPDARPRNMAMLIGGMMLTAFGLVMSGFAIVYQNTAPIDMNAEAAR